MAFWSYLGIWKQDRTLHTALDLRIQLLPTVECLMSLFPSNYACFAYLRVGWLIRFYTKLHTFLLGSLLPRLLAIYYGPYLLPCLGFRSLWHNPYVVHPQYARRAMRNPLWVRT
jgi:hypothetical protein